MKSNKRKGFTLVELLVVIAILAILATVSVVGYLSFTEKAKQSNDESLITQLNTVLEGNEVLEGKPSTMYEVLSQVEDAGYSVEKLTPTSSNNEFLWDQDENKFVIAPVDELENTIDPSLWVIVDTQEELTKLKDNYSVYLSSVFSTDQTTLDLTNGFDAGDYVDFETINFSTDKTITVTIRMNGGTLNVAAPNATVNHYGESDLVDITSVAMDSYHEFGNVENVSISQGRFVDETGKVEKYYIEGNNVNISTTSNSKVLLLLSENINSLTFNGTLLEKPEETTGEYSILIDKNNNTYNSKVVSTLDELLNELKTDCYIVIGKSFVVSETVSIPSNTKITLDLNDNVLTVPAAIDGVSLYALYNYGELTIKDSSLNGNGKISSRGIQNQSEGYLFLESGRIESIDSNGGGAAVWNEGYFKMTGGTIAFTGKNSGNSTGATLNVQNGSTAIITGGKVLSPYTSIFSYGNLTIKNISLDLEESNWHAVKTYAGCVATLENVTVNSINGGGVENAGGEVTITNCYFIQKGIGSPSWNSVALAVSNGGTTIINGGRYEGTTAAAYVFNSGGTIIINDGTFVGSNGVCLKADNTSNAWGSTIIVNNGNFDGSFEIGTTASLNISAGIFSDNPTDYVMDGKNVIVLNDGKYQVK